MWHHGRAWFLGDDIDTDQIMPARWLALRSAEELGRHVLSGADPAWPERIAPGDILVGGANFGCGSSREHAPLGIKGRGVACVVARSFSRIFYRNAVNIGLPLLVLRQEIADRRQGRDAMVDIAAGRLSFDEGATVLQCEAPAPIVLEILSHGGLMDAVTARMRGGGDTLTADDVEATKLKIDHIVAHSVALTAKHPSLRDDELYDENGM